MAALIPTAIPLGDHSIRAWMFVENGNCRANMPFVSILARDNKTPPTQLVAWALQPPPEKPQAFADPFDEEVWILLKQRYDLARAGLLTLESRQDQQPNKLNEIAVQYRTAISDARTSCIEKVITPHSFSISVRQDQKNELIQNLSNIPPSSADSSAPLPQPLTDERIRALFAEFLASKSPPQPAAMPAADPALVRAPVGPSAPSAAPAYPAAAPAPAPTPSPVSLGNRPPPAVPTQK